ncbi:MAG: hypothetical protein Q9174_004666 [Haloplaca sp. 1 TL-2023]
MSSLQRCLRPALPLSRSRHGTATASYLRLYSIARYVEGEKRPKNYGVQDNEVSSQARLRELIQNRTKLYPRYKQDATTKIMSIRRFTSFFMKLQVDEIGKSELALYEPPTLQSLCLHDFPTELQDQETRIQNRHVDFLVNPKAAEIIRLKSEITQEIRQFLTKSGHVEVQTPIMASLAGGAVARAFETSAVEFPDRHIELRTAPELWLKRLVLGGMEKIFEIGPCFRNEGLDKTHNPEFTTCEFYAAYKNLDDLIATTEHLLSDLFKATSSLIETRFTDLPPCEIKSDTPYQRLDFIPELESALGLKLPDLRSKTAEAEVADIFRQRNIRLPTSLRLPRLLDRLASEYLEPRCQNPTWIMHPPECLSPLSKSFVSRETSQWVAARAELFIGGKEVVNTYEEENSPFEQRRKFQEQVRYRDDENRTSIDESYIEALEWGLPPTGGWGCGIDRLAMLLSGTDRINDVLPFGNLRNVVSLGKGGGSKINRLEVPPDPLQYPTSVSWPKIRKHASNFPGEEQEFY